MVLSFYGGAKTVTGSKHLVTLENGKRILLDCGMFQGLGAKGQDLNRDFRFPADSVDYLILSHAHIDHSGLIPRLVNKGFNGKIFCTPQTKEICELVLADSAKIQEQAFKEARNKSNQKSYKHPLYTQKDVEKSLALFKTVPYETLYKIDDDIDLFFTDAGHILGSAVVNLSVKENGKTRTLAFTGDLGRFENRILRRPQPFPQAEIIICEATYGDSFHEKIKNTEERLRKIIQETCIEKKGKLLIPAFSIGKTQELIYSLNVLAEDGRLPDVKVFVDSPLSVYATDIIRDHQECFNNAMHEYIKTDPDPFGFEGLVFVSDHDDSQLLELLDEPCIILSTSGMMEAGRIRNHFRKSAEDPNTRLLFTGYCEPSTLAGKLLRGDKEVVVDGDMVDVYLEVAMMREYSAHADYGDFLKFFNCQEKEQVKQIFLVHGEEETMKKFKTELHKDGFKKVEIADYMISYEV